jgi:hypothetical protein
VGAEVTDLPTPEQILETKRIDLALAEVARSQAVDLARIDSEMQAEQARIEAGKHLEAKKAGSQTIVAGVSGLIVLGTIGGSVFLSSIGKPVSPAFGNLMTMLAGGLNLILGIKIGESKK